MARNTLYNFGRGNRSGTVITPTFVIPAEPGIIASTLDVLPNQRDDPSRRIDFFFEVQEPDASWAVISTGQWTGNPDVTTMPTEEFLSVAGALDFRGRTARWRAVVSGTASSINFGGTIEWWSLDEWDTR